MGILQLYIISLTYISFIYSYPTRYIYNRFNLFFNHYPTKSTILPLLNNENNFATFHRLFLNQPTIHEHQIASRIAKTINPDKNDTVDNPAVERKRNKQSKWLNNLIIHYTHEKRLAAYKQDIHEIWNHTFQQTPVLDTRLIIGNRNSKNLTKQLVRRRPQCKNKKRPLSTNKNLR
jgi:hypothetical protein